MNAEQRLEAYIDDKRRAAVPRAMKLHDDVTDALETRSQLPGDVVALLESAQGWLQVFAESGRLLDITEETEAQTRKALGLAPGERP
jgi:hypothetical protein